MNTGVIIRHMPQGQREAFDMAAQRGFRHCQLVSWNPELWTRENAEAVADCARASGVAITAFWCGWSGPKAWNFTEGPQTLGLVPVAWRAQRFRELLSGAAYARAIGVMDVATHMGFIPENMSDPEWPGVVSTVKALARELGAHGQNLLLETGQETPVTLRRLMDACGADNLFVNLDPANLILYGKGNPLDAMALLGPYVRGVHAKDGFYPTDGLSLGREAAVGEGQVNFPELLRLLRAHGYDGSLTIEREIEGEEQIRDILRTRDYLNALISGTM